jgi:hypothetical protein
MPRTKSRTTSASSSRKSSSSRSNGSRMVGRSEEPSKIRRYLEFVRAIVSGTSRNGR